MDNFIQPPSVKGTLNARFGEGVGEAPFSPLKGDIVKQIIALLCSATDQKEDSTPNWTPQEEELLRSRWERQGVYIPELRRPYHASLEGFLSGRFSADEIGRKAVTLKLIAPRRKAPKGASLTELQ